MSLEVTILDTNDQVIRSVGLGVDEHWELMQLATAARLPLLERLHDYYSDSQIEVRELPAFLQEVRALGSRDCLSPRLRQILDDLAQVTECAMSEMRVLTVLAD
ncbi:MAG: hypothetical protein IT457_22560 [Planctomycetes bacterium]|nr:hypothetical protein [Planctomycetota bacterium]